MKEIITEIITNFLLMLVRTIFGAFIGGFLGSVMGVLVTALLFLDKASNRIDIAATMGTLVFIGALFGALIGASNLLAPKDIDKLRPKDSRRGNSKSGEGDGNGE
jgi:gas vesicle protein